MSKSIKTKKIIRIVEDSDTDSDSDFKIEVSEEPAEPINSVCSADNFSEGYKEGFQEGTKILSATYMNNELQNSVSSPDLKSVSGSVTNVDTNPVKSSDQISKKETLQKTKRSETFERENSNQTSQTPYTSELYEKTDKWASDESTSITLGIISEKQEELISKYSTCSEYSKECNDVLNEKELFEQNLLGSLSYPLQIQEYPNLNDPNFNSKIASKIEFGVFKYNGEIKDLEEYSNELSNAPFELSPHQYFIKNFLSPSTPYNSVLLFHGLGTGKTCSAIGIAEEERDFMKNMISFKQIIIVATPNVQENFMLQLFNENDLKNEDGSWVSSSCLGNKFINEVNPTNKKGVPKNVIKRQITSLIAKYYKFMGYEQFSSKIEEIIVKGNGDKFKTVKNVQLFFDGRLVIFDEIHHASEDTEKKNISKNLMLLVKMATIKMVLLTATPMFNNCKEIVWLINLMNLNDKRSRIYTKDIFTDNDEFIVSDDDVGKNLLIRKSRGYISYVRSDNPYIFPFRVYPYVFAPEHTFKSMMEVVERDSTNEYPNYQLNGLEIEEDSKMKFLGVYLDEIGDYQSLGYNYIIDALKDRPLTMVNKVGELVNVAKITNMVSFNYTILQNPIQALNIIYPYNLLENEIVESTEHIGGGDQLFDSVESLVNTAINSVDKNVVILKNQNGGGVTFDPRLLIGTRGLKRVMNYEDTDTIKGNFSYNPEILEKYGPIFRLDLIGNYSCKIKNICENISNSTGIILVYSQYLDSGIIPMALALEEMGYDRFKGNNLFSKRPRQSNKLKYIMITGSTLLSPNNAEEYNAARSDKNINGDVIKVILISSAGSEGLDFKCVRQVHVMEPWYNMSKVEQVLGRAIRNFSHKLLPFIERNVQIFLHATMLKNRDEEAADLYIYRTAEKKAERIGKVTRLLKENAIDCLVNNGQLNFDYKNFENMHVRQILSNGTEIDNLTVGDVPYSPNCDYQASCKYTCINKSVELSSEMEDLQSLNKMNEFVVKTILYMFKLEHFYKISDFLLKFTRNQVDYAFTKLIDEETIIYDKYNRPGKIVNVGEYYLFQPIELNDKQITIFERSVPIDIKMQGIMFNMKKDRLQTKRADLEIDQELNKLLMMDKGVIEIDEKDIMLTPQELGVFFKKPQILIDAETEYIKVQRLIEYPANINKANWYEYCAVVFHQLLNNNIMNKEDLDEYLIDHMIDCMIYRNKRALLHYLFEIPTHTQFELLLLNGFKRNVQDGYILLYDNESKENKMLIFEKDGNIIRDALPEDIRLRPIRKKKKLQQYIGFIDARSDYIFKIRDITNTRSSGLNCANYKKPNLLALLNTISAPNVYTAKYDAKALCVFLEIYMRNHNKYNEIKWFYSTEDAIES